MKKFLLALLAIGLLSAGSLSAAEQTSPKSVIHVVTVAWKSSATPEQIKAALDGATALPAAFPGITRVWTRTLKAQGGKANVIAMEFKDEAALKAYSDSDAQKNWYKAYLPIREESTTFDATN